MMAMTRTQATDAQDAAPPAAKKTTTTQKTTSSDQIPTPPAVPQPPAAPGGTLETGVQFDPNYLAGRVESIALGFFFTMGFIIVGLPIARAWARRMDRRGAGADTSAIPADLTERLTRIEQAVESMSIEVERVSEGQRFTTKLLSERAAEPAALPGRESR